MALGVWVGDGMRLAVAVAGMGVVLGVRLGVGVRLAVAVTAGREALGEGLNDGVAAGAAVGAMLQEASHNRLRAMNHFKTRP